MSTSNFLIGPIGDGLRKDAKAWATPQDSFQYMLNAYQFRGRVVKRSGYTTLGRLTPDGVTFPGLPVMGLKTREQFGIGLQELIGFDTQNSYHFVGSSFATLPSVMPVTWSGTDSDFFWTANYAGAFWATNSKPGLNGWQVTAFAGEAGTGTAATVNVTSAGNTAAVDDIVYFLNITGSAASNNLVFAKVITAGDPVLTVQAIDVPATFTWSNGVTSTGMMLDSTQTVTGQDGIRYYATTELGNTWVNYNPPIDGVNALAGALMIFPYRGYLVFLNTSEGNNDTGIKNFGNRARWTQIGTPYYSAPVPNFPSLQTIDHLAVRDDLFGRGGANDAPTSEVIVSAEFIRDILVVYFERSTWRLRFVNNSQNPFVWERVNIELGSDCTFSSIAFDKGLMTIGKRGIVISDGNDTVRFDEKIPNDIFKIRTVNDGLQRVYGIRTFRTKLCYWTYPSDTNPTGIYPDQVLVFNYDTKNWSYFDDSFTCFGYYYPGGTGQIWNDLINPWNTYGNVNWDSAFLESGSENVIAGNQQGFVFLLEQDSGTNGPSLAISNITGSTVTSNNHNLKDGDWITLSGVTGTEFADNISLNGKNYKVANPALNANTFTLMEFKPIRVVILGGSSFTYPIGWKPIIPGSVLINVGSLEFTDPNLDGVLVSTGSNSGTIDYSTGFLNLSFNPPIGPSAVNIRVVTLDPLQDVVPVSIFGVYTGGGLIAKISNFDIQTKTFNFFNDDKRSRLSKIDFYVNATDNGQCIANIYADSGFDPVNTPLSTNLQSNVVLTSTNPFQFGEGEETIYRLYCDAIAQTISLELTMSDQQMATNSINGQNFELLAMNFTMKRGGRLV